MKKYIDASKIIILASVLALGVSSLYAWTGPTATAPNGNVSAPINVGLNSQSKLGQLFLNTSLSNPYAIGLSVFGQSIFNGPVQITSGTPGVGKVLTSVDASGTVAWQQASSLVASTSSSIPDGIVSFTSSGTWTAPAGVTRVHVRVWGAGGTGAAGSGGGTHSVATDGGGGGGGGYGESVVAVTPGTTYTITVGQAGSLGSFSNTAFSSSGVGPSASGASSFGSFVVSNPGLPGNVPISSNSAGTPGIGGTSNGTISIPGQSGAGARGGNSFGAAGAAGGVYPQFPGGGGAGVDVGGGYPATLGANGLVIVEY